MKLFTGLLLFVIFHVGTPALGEEVWYPEDKWPVATIKEKLQLSMSRAYFSAEGYFSEINPNSSLELLNDNRGMLTVEFNILRRLDKNKIIDSPTRLKIVVYRPEPGMAAAPDASAFALSRKIERNASGTLVNLPRYHSALKEARLPLLSNQDYLKEFFIVPVSVGSLDSRYRKTDVVVKIGKKYLVFVMCDISGKSERPIFQTDFDIYDAEEPEVMDILQHAD